MAGGFKNYLTTKLGQLVIAAIASPNYVPGSDGWQIRKDGSAEFNNLTIRGTFNGTDFIINSSGAFFYSGTPAAGNPPAWWVTSGSLADPFGNTLPATQGSIANFGGSNWQAFCTANGFLQWFFATAKTGPWSNGASIVAGNNLNGDLELDSNCATISEFYLGNGQILLTFPSTFGALTGVSVVPGKGITAQVGQLDESWHTLTLTNATASGNGVNGMRYKLMPDNSLALEWDINTNSHNSVTIATLPAGWRPAVAHNIASGSYGGSTTLTSVQNPHLIVNTNGTIGMAGTSGAAFSMCGTARIGMD